MADTQSQTLEGETKIEGSNREYWNSKSGGYAKKGDQIKGVLLRMEADEYKGKPTTQYVLRDIDDAHEVYLPNHTILNGMMAQVKIGRTVRVVYLGKSEKTSRGRNAPELYDVFMTADAIKDVPKEKQDDKNPLVADASTQLLRMVANSTVGINDVDFWKNAQVLTGGNLSGAMSMVQHLKEKGELFQDKDGFWKVGK